MRVRRTAAQFVSCFQSVRAQVRWHICTHLHCYSLFQYRDKKRVYRVIFILHCGDSTATTSSVFPEAGYSCGRRRTRGRCQGRTTDWTHTRSKLPVKRKCSICGRCGNPGGLKWINTNIGGTEAPRFRSCLVCAEVCHKGSNVSNTALGSSASYTVCCM